MSARALNSSSPLGLEGVGAGKIRFSEGKKTKDPEGVDFPLRRCEGALGAAAEPREARFEGGELVRLCLARKRLLGRPRASCGAGLGSKNRLLRV
jgi:hypothetical protein